MNRNEIWQQLKDEKQTVYGKSMLDVFLTITNELNIKHLEEALDSGYNVNDDMLIRKLNENRISSELLDKIISNKKDMGGKLTTTILRLYDPEEMQKVAQKININKMTLDDIHTLFWLKTSSVQDIKENSIEIMSELFGDKLKQFDVKQIFALIRQVITVDQTSLDKIVDAIGGWKSLVEKMMHEQDSLAKNGQLNPTHYENLKINLNDSRLNKYFAEKIIEYGRDMNLKFIDAENLAKAFYPNVGNN